MTPALYNRSRNDDEVVEELRPQASMCRHSGCVARSVNIPVLNKRTAGAGDATPQSDVYFAWDLADEREKGLDRGLPGHVRGLSASNAQAPLVELGATAQ